jgi:hypothetical protein
MPRPAVTPTRARLLRIRLHGADAQAGMTTAEYAVGTVAACAFGGVLYKVITSTQVLGLLRDVIAQAFRVSF